jgi:hypothetical protein
VVGVLEAALPFIAALRRGSRSYNGYYYYRAGVEVTSSKWKEHCDMDGRGPGALSAPKKHACRDNRAVFDKQDRRDDRALSAPNRLV